MTMRGPRSFLYVRFLRHLDMMSCRQRRSKPDNSTHDTVEHASGICVKNRNERKAKLASVPFSSTMLDFAATTLDPDLSDL